MRHLNRSKIKTILDNLHTKSSKQRFDKWSNTSPGKDCLSSEEITGLAKEEIQSKLQREKMVDHLINCDYCGFELKLELIRQEIGEEEIEKFGKIAPYIYERVQKAEKQGRSIDKLPIKEWYKELELAIEK